MLELPTRFVLFLLLAGTCAAACSGSNSNNDLSGNGKGDGKGNDASSSGGDDASASGAVTGGSSGGGASSGSSGAAGGTSRHGGGSSGSDSGGTATSSGDASGSSSGGASGAGSADAGGDGGVDPAAPAGSAGIAAFCTAWCSRAMACAVMADAGTVRASCATDCETTNAAGAIYRVDYWASATTCISKAACADVLGDTAGPACFSGAAASSPTDNAVVAFCARFETIATGDGGGCLSGDCLSTYNKVNDTAVNALAACISVSNFCADIDAGAACTAMALTP